MKNEDKAKIVAAACVSAVLAGLLSIFGVALGISTLIVYACIILLAATLANLATLPPREPKDKEKTASWYMPKVMKLVPVGTPNVAVGPTIGVAEIDLYLALIPDVDGYSAVVMNLPGVGGCGPTENDAIDDAKLAAVAAISSFRADGEPVAWRNEFTTPDGTEVLRKVSVEVEVSYVTD